MDPHPHPHQERRKEPGHGVMPLAYVINVLCFAVIAAILVGLYQLLSGAKLNMSSEISLVVGTLLGSIVTFVMQAAAQANGYAFGSSPSARATAAKLADAAQRAQPPGATS